jgi:cysteinyl-tRNA synthetase
LPIVGSAKAFDGPLPFFWAWLHAKGPPFRAFFARSRAWIKTDKQAKMLSIYNTLTRQKERFEPIDPGKVRMYVCGMTVYDYCHVGHARVMVVFDMVVRWLKACGFSVTYVRNITDIDDKIIKRAAENHESLSALTDRFIHAMHEDARALGVLPPDAEPRATAHVPAMCDLIARLIERGYAYIADDGDVCYAVRRFEGYGKLSGKSLDDLRAGERVNIRTDKRDPLDFVLWKKAREDEPAEARWASPWGEGRPGWHIECSAMSAGLLSPHFDIHGGGADLQFPHHENEIAQSEAAHGHPYVNYWMHNGFVRVDDEKMSKSLGNFFTIRDVLARFDPEVIRFFILRAHYRSPLNYADPHLEEAHAALSRLYAALRHLDEKAAPPPALNWESPYPARFKAAMDDDFNTPEALVVLFELANEIQRAPSAELAWTLRRLAGLLGFLERPPPVFFQGGERLDSDAHAQIERAIAQRAAAKKERDFGRADAIRAELAARGILLEDSPQGTLWRCSGATLPDLKGMRLA